MIGPHARALLFGSLLTAFGYCSQARAEPARVLFIAPRATPFSARIRAEIEAMDFQVVPSDEFPSADDAGASAAARVIETPPPRRVELWLRDAQTGRLAFDRVLDAELERGGESDSDSTAAVQVSERLRAFFQPLREPAAAVDSMPPRPPAPRLEPRPAPNRVVRFPAPAPNFTDSAPPDEGRYFQEIAGALPIEPGSLALSLLIRGRYRFPSRFGLGVKVVLPIVPSNVRAGVNQADVSSSLFGLEISHPLLTARQASLGAHLGLSLLLLNASGNAQLPYTNRVDRTFTAFPSLGLDFGLHLTRELRWCVGTELGVSSRELSVAFAGQRVASWARPLALLSTGLAIEWGRP